MIEAVDLIGERLYSPFPETPGTGWYDEPLRIQEGQSIVRPRPSGQWSRTRNGEVDVIGHLASWRE